MKKIVVLMILFGFSVYGQDCKSVYNGSGSMSDSTCEIGRSKAEKDVSNGRWKYYESFEISQNEPIFEEIKAVLAKKKIVAIRQSLICGETVHPEDLSAYCYEQAMNKAMELKFGREFMKVVRIDATKQFLGKNPKFIFGFGSCDTVARYPNCANYSEHFTNYKRDFLEKVPCPKDFTFEKVNERFSYLNASFVLHADGRISGVKVSASFVNPDDDKFAEYYLSQLEAFIENTKWVPATVYGQKVDSEVPLVIHFPRF